MLRVLILNIAHFVRKNKTFSIFMREYSSNRRFMGISRSIRAVCPASDPRCDLISQNLHAFAEWRRETVFFIKNPFHSGTPCCIIKNLIYNFILFIRLYNPKRKAEKQNGYVVGYIDYIGGLEFDAVVIVGVDKGRVPQVTSTESRIYQNYEWHNRMYVAITRAKYAVVILGNKSRTPSTLLQNAISNKRITLVE